MSWLICSNVVFGPVFFLPRSLCLFQFCNHFAEKEGIRCYTLTVLVLCTSGVGGGGGGWGGGVGGGGGTLIFSYIRGLWSFFSFKILVFQ